MDEALDELDYSFLPGALSSVVANNIWSFIIASLARIAMFKSTRFIAYATPTQSPTLKNECEVQRTVTKFFPTIGKIFSFQPKKFFPTIGEMRRLNCSGESHRVIHPAVSCRFEKFETSEPRKFRFRSLKNFKLSDTSNICDRLRNQNFFRQVSLARPVKSELCFQKYTTFPFSGCLLKNVLLISSPTFSLWHRDISMAVLLTAKIFGG